MTTIAQEEQKIEQVPVSEAANNTSDSQPVAQQLDLSPENAPFGQVTNVSPLRDVEPADWTYEALSSLVLITPAPSAESFFPQLRHH